MLAVVILEMTGRHVVQTTDLARPEFPRGKKSYAACRHRAAGFRTAAELCHRSLASLFFLHTLASDELNKVGVGTG
jgi:hypothetical protein